MYSLLSEVPKTIRIQYRCAKWPLPSSTAGTKIFVTICYHILLPSAYEVRGEVMLSLCLSVNRGVGGTPWPLVLRSFSRGGGYTSQVPVQRYSNPPGQDQNKGYPSPSPSASQDQDRDNSSPLDSTCHRQDILRAVWLLRSHRRTFLLINLPEIPMHLQSICFMKIESSCSNI